MIFTSHFYKPLVDNPLVYSPFIFGEGSGGMVVSNAFLLLNGGFFRLLNGGVFKLL